jgi:small conductance mechanosensitive channel
MSSVCAVLLSLCFAGPLPEQEPMGPPAPPKAEAPKPDEKKPAKAETEAEKIARIQRSVEDGDKQLAEIKKQVEDPQSECALAQAAFKKLDEKVQTLNRELKRLEALKKPTEAAELKKELAGLQTRWKQARDRADIALEERRILQSKAGELARRVDTEKKYLEKLLNGGKTPAKDPKKTDDSKKPVNTKHARGSKKDEVSKTPKPDDRKKAATSRDKAAEEVKSEADEKETGRKKSIKEDEKLREAREQARIKEDEALDARERVKKLTDYMEGVSRQVELEKRLLETSRKKVKLAREAHAELDQEQKARIARNAPAMEVLKGWGEVNEAARRIDSAAAEERDSSDRLTDLQSQFARLQSRQIQLLEEAKKRDTEARTASKEVASLENPFNPRNILQWFINHGGKMLAILLGMLCLYIITHTSTRRVVRAMSTRTMRRGREGEDRAETLVGVFRSAATLVILGGGTLMLLDEVGIPIVPLMGGAAVFGLAVAFGAQNLIRDYFTGFMVLMEDQYAVNDVVRINGVDGKVERITLRMTVLRDLGGLAHFVPHGSITTVSNMTHGWSRALLEIGVAYKENTDHVVEVLERICADLRNDPKFGPMILEDAEMLGVNELGISSVTIQFVMKTKPLKQWLVKRELLRRIKKKFDQLGIEIPFPQRVIHHRYEGGENQDQTRNVA